MRARIEQLLDGDGRDGGWDRFCYTILVGFLFLNIGTLILDTVPTIHAKWDAAFDIVEYVSLGVFALEYLVRLWAGGGRYARSAYGVIDLLVVLGFALPGGDPDPLSALRILAVLKLWRFTEAGQLVTAVVWRKRRELTTSFALLCMCILMASTAVYFAEHGAQPDKFPSIPAATWWGVVTMTTVGYGDVAPITTLGKLLGGLTAILGVSTFALFTTILATSLSEELEARKKTHELYCDYCGRG